MSSRVTKRLGSICSNAVKPAAIARPISRKSVVKAAQRNASSALPAQSMVQASWSTAKSAAPAASFQSKRGLSIATRAAADAAQEVDDRIPVTVSPNKTIRVF